MNIGSYIYETYICDIVQINEVSTYNRTILLKFM